MHSLSELSETTATELTRLAGVLRVKISQLCLDRYDAIEDGADDDVCKIDEELVAYREQIRLVRARIQWEMRLAVSKGYLEVDRPMQMPPPVDDGEAWKTA